MTSRLAAPLGMFPGPRLAWRPTGFPSAQPRFPGEGRTAFPPSPDKPAGPEGPEAQTGLPVTPVISVTGSKDLTGTRGLRGGACPESICLQLDTGTEHP